MADEILQRLFDYASKDVDRRADEQKESLKPLNEKRGYVVRLGKHIVHHDKRTPKKEVEHATKEIYRNDKLQILNNLLEPDTWEDPKKRAMMIKELNDVESSLPAMLGIKGASRFDEHMNAEDNIQL